MHSARWTTFSKAAGQLLTFATTLMLVRLLHKEDFGLFAMALFYIWIIDNVTDFGFLSAIIQRKQIGLGELSSCFWLIAGASLLVILISQIMAPALAWLFSEVRIKPIMRVLSFAFLMFPFTVVCTGVLSRQLRLDVVATSELGAGVVRSIVALWLATAGAGVLSLVYAYLIERVVLGVMLVLRSRWRPQWVFDWQPLKPLVKFGLGVTGSRLLWFAVTRMDTLIIGRLLGAQILGVYTIAAQMATAFSQFIAATGYRLAFPILSKHQDSRHFEELLTQMSVYLSMVVLPAAAGISVLAPDLVAVFLGETWQGAVLPLRVLAVAAALQTLSGLLPQAINARGRSDVGAWINAASLVVFGAAFYYGALWHGLSGVLGAWLIIAPLRYGAMLFATRSVLRIEISRFLVRHTGLLAATATMLCVILAIGASISQWPATTRLILSIGAGGLVYITTLWLVMRQVVSDLLRFIHAPVKAAS